MTKSSRLFFRRALWALPLSFLLCYRPLLADEPEKIWTLGIAVFSVEGGAPVGIANRVPLLMLSRLQTLPPRLVDMSGQTEALDMERSLYEAGAELSARLDARASAFLAPGIEEAERLSRLRSSAAGVKEAGKKIEQLKNPPPAKLKAKAKAKAAKEATQALPLKTALWPGHAGGELLSAPKDNLRAMALEKKLDFIVHGRASLIQGYVMIELYGYDAALGRQVFSWKEFCAPEDPGPAADKLARDLERWIAGRDFARVDVETDPASAVLEAGGVLEAGLLPFAAPLGGAGAMPASASPFGTGRTFFAFEPGSAFIQAREPGYGTRRLELDLVMGELVRQTIKLEKLNTGALSVTTEPGGASLSLDALPAGTSPRTIELDGSRQILGAAAPGTESAMLILPASGQSSVDIRLLPDDGLGPAKRIEKAKNAFYKSLGWFVLSLPLTALSYGSYTLFDDAAMRSGREDMLLGSQVSGGIAIGALVINVGLAINATVMLVRYIRSTR